MGKKIRRLGDHRSLPCPRCGCKWEWGYERETHTIIRGYFKSIVDIGENDRYIKNTTRSRRVCGHCGYWGVWQYGFLFDVKRKQEAPPEEPREGE